MTADQFRAICAELELATQGSTAEFLGVEDRTVRRWAAGAPIPDSVVMTLCLTKAGGYTPAQARKIAKLK